MRLMVMTWPCTELISSESPREMLTGKWKEKEKITQRIKSEFFITFPEAQNFERFLITIGRLMWSKILFWLSVIGVKRKNLAKILKVNFTHFRETT